MMTRQEAEAAVALVCAARNAVTAAERRDVGSPTGRIAPQGDGAFQAVIYARGIGRHTAGLETSATITAPVDATAAKALVKSLCAELRRRAGIITRTNRAITETESY